MDRPFPLKFDLPSPAKCLRVERVDDIFADGHWRLWLMANGDFSLGTFIQLLDNGTIFRITWHEDGTTTIFPLDNHIETDK
jgi:hypothetical protein